MTEFEREVLVVAADQSLADHQAVHRWRAFAVLAVAYFMTIVDLTIVNVALPTIGRDLHFSETNLQWVVAAYGLTFGGFLLLGERAADLLGRRRILTAASSGRSGSAARSGSLQSRSRSYSSEATSSLQGP